MKKAAKKAAQEKRKEIGARYEDEKNVQHPAKEQKPK